MAIVWSLAEVWEAVTAQSWPSVDGEVTGVRLLERRDDDGSVEHARWVRYRFEVGGRTYEGSRVRFGEGVPRDGDGGYVAVAPEGGSVPDLARAAASDGVRYREGDRVRVYYDPDDPGLCILDRRLHVNALLIGAAGLAAFTYGIWPLLSGA